MLNQSIVVIKKNGSGNKLCMVWFMYIVTFVAKAKD